MTYFWKRKKQYGERNDIENFSRLYFRSIFYGSQKRENTYLNSSLTKASSSVEGTAFLFFLDGSSRDTGLEEVPSFCFSLETIGEGGTEGGVKS